MIYTCTLNPAIDYRMDLDNYVKGGLNRARETAITPGGKGINVSIVLKRLGKDSVALGFEGGFTGRFLKDYLKEEYGLTVAFIHVDAQTRINVKIAEKGDTKETEVNGPAPEVTDEDYRRLLTSIRKLGKKDILVLGGSDISNRFKSYETIASICDASDVPFIVDGEKENVTSVLKHRPLLLKPNLHELETISGRTLKTEESILRAARTLIDAGARYVIVSMGEQGSYLITPKKAYHSEAINGDVINTVGAGDSMVAGFIDRYTENGDPLEAYRRAVAAGSATAFSPSFPDKKVIDALESEVKIREVDQ